MTPSRAVFVIGAIVSIHFLATAALSSYCAPLYWTASIDEAPYWDRHDLCAGPAVVITLPVALVWMRTGDWDQTGTPTGGWPRLLPEQLVMAGLNSLMWGGVMYVAYRAFGVLCAAYRLFRPHRPQQS